MPQSRSSGELHLEVAFRDPKLDGWSKARFRQLPRSVLLLLPEEGDRRILGLLAGAEAQLPAPAYSGPDADLLPFRYRLNDAQARWLLPELCQSGRAYLRLHETDEEDGWVSARWQPAPEGIPPTEPWQLTLIVRPAAAPRHYELAGELTRQGAHLDPAAVLFAGPGVLFAREGAARVEPASSHQWLPWLVRHAPLSVPAGQCEALIGELLRQPGVPPLTVPKEQAYEEVSLPPRPLLVVRPGADADAPLRGELSFEYGPLHADHRDSARALVDSASRRLLLRDSAAEWRFQERLQRLGWQWTAEKHGLELTPRHLPRVVQELTAEGWHVEAEGKLYRSPGKVDIRVKSGIDWFELHGEVQFGDVSASLPALLSALRRGAGMVRLGDGTYGLLPEEWLKQYGLLAGVGKAHGDHLRFQRSQAAMLDALLLAHPEAEWDAGFGRVRAQLQRFRGVQPASPPAGFRGRLRPYQQEGLGWLHFLREFGFGGCLADDMGLGKTVQVLALLEERRALRARARGRGKIGPSLIVVPKSLIFNWKQEAARFAPRLRLLDHTGAMRHAQDGDFSDHDVVLTTYGTLIRDITELKKVRFDYVILDEAQAIKNADSASAKAARLLTGEQRLAMSGTPIENHLGELWSLFEFLNPGMLGAASVFQLSRGAARNPDHETRRVLSQALRPFLLRRTKSQVVKDLPAKLEQTLWCDMDRAQRSLYDELREHYRVSLMQRIEAQGMNRARIQILEALLRLRQAAIHPGLLDRRRRGESSAKLDMLLPRLTEVAQEGHKALVFSQFTGMLAILRGHLDEAGIPYEYLDGKTRNRQECVKRFQEDPDCRLFLISLKAGGVGLNLTAAQYVFLLDPWWNPAVEAQAIDRAHRIGQRARVFAYRLISRGTVEEKVLELQRGKRELADAIVGADNSLIRNLGREDLQLLLS